MGEVGQHLELAQPRAVHQLQPAVAAGTALHVSRSLRRSLRRFTATVDADYEQARLEREVNEGLAKDGLVSTLILKQSTIMLIHGQCLNDRQPTQNWKYQFSVPSDHSA